ncbi:non-ribosomal peptide synthetase, partial [Nostoc sp. NOS(2021)]|uniref:non-ribosomal peptide synthetase n=1 Tax=Nostoc sp. NOS(2021) TaxID=2815407 RepID=UPI0025E5DC60
MQEQIQGFSLSPQQKRLWLLQKDSQAYQAHCAIILEGNLKKEVLKEALNQIVNRHEILRTTFHCINGVKTPIQVINEYTFISLNEAYLEDKDAIEFEIEKLFQSASQQSLDLDKGSLLLATLVTLTPQKHLLIVSLPALCADAPTLNNLVCELSRCYAACLEHEKLSEQPLQYADISEWQNELLQTEELKAESNYWRKFDVFNIGELKLPYSNQLINNPEFKPQSLSLDIPLDLVTKIDVTLAQHKNITSYVFFLTCWQILLCQLTGKSDMIIGMASNGRNYEQLQETLGLLVKYLPFQCNLQNNYKFSDLLNIVAEATEEIFECQESFSWEQSVSTLNGNSQQQPFFPFCFEFTSLSARYYADSICFSIYKQYACVDQFQVKLSCVRRDDDRIAAEFHYDANVYVVEDIQRLASQFETLLASVVKNIEGAIASFDILSPLEREQLLVEFNNTKTAAPQHQCIHQWFESQCDRTPDNIAVVCENQQLTYSELNAQANQLAHYLQKMGVGPEIMVGICTERSLDMVVGVLGILKAGGAYLPLDPIYPKERLTFILEESCTPVLLTQQKLLSILPECSAELCCLDYDWEKIALESTQNPISKTISDNLAYVIYTSGSTGKPKGTLIPHQGLVNYLTWCTQAYAVDLGEGATVHSTLAFDLTITGLFSPLVVGRRVELIPEDQSMECLGNALRNGSNYSLVKITPAQLQLLEKHLSSSEAAGKTRALIIGGENLLAESITFWQNFAPSTILVNEYGPTETVVGCCIYQVPKGEMLSGSVPIGHAIANTELYVLNQYHKPVPIGVPGELYIGGLGLARGYFNRLELTAEKFIPNPFSEQPGARLYKTGDLVCYRLDGNLEFLGRIDNQVKVRGFRIELGEIEGLLKQHPSVRETIVMAREDVPGDQRLVAYVVSKSDATPIPSELRSYLKQHLPEYMLPSAFVLMDALPLTTNGKVDRRALPAPDQTRPELQETFVAPCTAIEEILAGIWAQILGLEEVGIHNNFFELGGHSLLATQVISQVRKVFQQEVSLRRLFEQPTIAGLAKDIEQATKAGLGLETATIERISRSQELPLSFAQQRLWFLAQFEPNSPFYNIPAAVRLQGELNLKGLQQSFKEILRRHEALRTNFQTREGQAVAVISSATSLLLPVFDLSELPSNQQEAEIRQLVDLEAHQPFDLNSDLLLRVKLLRLNELEHILLLTMHHIASDGWSVGVLVREVATLYQTCCEQQSSSLAELPIQYVDFAAWQRQWLQAEVLQSQISYWKKQLEGAPAILELPTDHPRPAVITFQGASYSFNLSLELSQALNKFSQQQGSTLFMTLLAAFQTLLWRYTGNEDIVVGSPIANRNRQEIEGLIGFFVNTLVLRTNLAGNPTFGELLTRVREVALGAYAHQDLPFEQLVEQLQPQRDLSYTPLFQVMFVLQNAPMSALELPGLTLSLLESESRTAKFDLTLYMTETAEGLVGTLEYNSDLFESNRISRMAGHLQTLLSGIVANPQQQLLDLPLLTEVELALLAEWNHTEVEYPQEKCIHQLFEAQVEQTPNAIAVVFEDQQLTYRELNTRANQLAHYLQKLGVKPEVLVGICTERSLDMIVGLLGILKAGGAYVPLDPNYPQERLSFILKDSQVPVLLTQARLLEKLPEHEAQIVCLDTNSNVITQQSKYNPISISRADTQAYVIYTSGSTGQPKGVFGLHRGAVNRFHWMWQIYPFVQGEVCCQKTSLNFVDSVWEIFGPLLQGVTTVIVPDEVVKDPQQFVATLTDNNVTRLVLVPSLLRILLNTSSVLQFQLPQLKLWISSGEALSIDLLGQFRQSLPDSTLLNLYGSSEVSGDVSCYSLSPQAPLPECVLIGRAIANTQIHVLDASRQSVPIGVRGELYISGDGLARGYLNQPELTAEKFIPNPFSDKSTARLYKTGDLARYLPNGDIEYIGRIDHQVKIRGFRIELGEIEALISQHSAVRETVIVVRLDSADSQRIVAYVVPDSKEKLTITELRRFLESKLPHYMVPAVFVMLEALPLTPNGKVDRKALPTPEFTQLFSESDFIPPATPIEQMLAGIWAEVLGIEKIGIYNNFFELGGHSLLATQVISQVRKVFQQEVSLRRLFEQPTIAGLAKDIEQATKAGLGLETATIERISRSQELPLSFAQQRLWFLAQFEPNSPFYNIPAAVRLQGELNLKGLQQSFKEILRRHEALRTNFQTREGQAVAVISSATSLLLPVFDLSELPSNQQEAEIRQLVDLEAHQPFDLNSDLLLRVKLLRLNELEHILLLTMHHIASDGWSVGVLVREVATLYQTCCEQQSSSLAELPIQYVDFAAWQRQWLQAEVLQSQISYWKKQLEGAPAILELPTDHPRPAVITFQGASYSFNLSLELSQALNKFSQQQGSTLFMTLLAAFQTLLWRYTGNEDIVVGSPIANRNRQEIEGLIGFFVNTLVLRTNLAGNPTFGELLTRVREVALGAYAHQDLPFEQLVEQLQPQRDLSYTPLFQVMFVLQNAPMSALELPGLTLSLLESESRTAKFDLTLYMTETAEGLVGTLEYNSDLFESNRISRMAGHLQTLLSGIVANPQQQLLDLPLLTEVELALLAEWNHTEVEYPQEKCIHQLFEAQVEQTPNAIAVVFEDQQLTYRELNTRANQLAHYLQKLGVKPEVLVGICTERSLDMIVGLLGILKAGGAYVPLDPNYPQERLSFILKDSQVPVLLTQARLL